MAMLLPAGLVAQGYGSYQALPFAQASGQRSYLGVNVVDVNADTAKEKKLGRVRGVEVTTVDPESAAAKAGLEKGDVVLEYDGQAVVGVQQFTRLVRETPAGRAVALEVSRNGQTRKLEATIGERPGAVTVMGSVIGTGEGRETPFGVMSMDVPRVFTTWRSARLGVEAEALESQLAEYFGVDEGVLVRSVSEDSAAEKAGFRAGDVITEVDGDKVTTPRDVSRKIERHTKVGESFVFRIQRNKQPMTLTVSQDQIEPRGNAPWGPFGPQRISTPSPARF